MITLPINGSNESTVNCTSKKCGHEACNKNYTTLSKCSRCRLQTYCGVECQKADWSRHKIICVPKTKIDNSKENKSTDSRETKSTRETKGSEQSITNSMIERPMPIPGLRLVENFISDDLHNRFIIQMNNGTSEMNNGHYDGYNFEDHIAFDKVFYELTKDVFSKLKNLNILSGEKPLKLACTLIGYEKNGFITRHVDSPLLSGGTVIVISFNSPVVVNFYSQKKTEEQQHKIFVPPKSMYAISGEARHDWSHAILSDEETYNSKKFERGTRYAVLFTPPGPLYSGSELLDY